MRPNGVVLEKTSHDEAHTNAQRIEAVHRFAEKLGKLCPHRTKKTTQDKDTDNEDS